MLAVILLLFFPTTSRADKPAYTAVDLILLNCGEPSKLHDIVNRSWDTDVGGSAYVPRNDVGMSWALPASQMLSSVPDQVPYRTARVFNSSFTYSFPVSTGHKFIRLYFYPNTYSTFNTSQSFFSVTANGFTLLSNFSAFLRYLSLPNEPSFMKEFIVNVGGDKRIELNFSPNPNSFAFINGIEIVSLPEGLYFRNQPITLVPVPNCVYYLQNNTALETLYRLNVGGADVQITEDSGIRGMFRYWSQDIPYILGADYGFALWMGEHHTIQYTTGTPPYTAPQALYKTYRTMTDISLSLEWTFSVDSGFYYLLRFHFCEGDKGITKVNQRVFTISISNMTAESELDIIALAGGNGIPIYKDYITWVPNDGHRGQRDLWISLYPYKASKPQYYDVLLSGLEIFKLSDGKQNPAAANPNPAPPLASHYRSPPLAPGKNSNRTFSILYPVLGSVIGVSAVVAAVSFLIFRCTKKMKDSMGTKSRVVPFSTVSEGPTMSTLHFGRVFGKRKTRASMEPLPCDLCKKFTLKEIIAATNNFDDSFIIGKGGFGSVYKGFIDTDTTTVAVKRLNASSNQGALEFFTEIKMLSRLRHLHLVSLIGYCIDEGEMILVYNYMEQGTLRQHLYNSDNPPLNWKQRLQICLGAAKGLLYLHTEAIIHRDVKSSNILLDSNLVAKMSDFGLSKIGPTDPTKTYVTTAVKGSIGYIDPEYYRRKQLTDKSDVFSFGVVLFEVLCARPAVLPHSPMQQANLATWVKSSYQEGTLEQIIDPNIRGEIAPECLYKFVETAIECIRDEGIKRPPMVDIVWSLELAAEMQAAAVEEGSCGYINPMPAFMLLGKRDPNATEEMFPGTTEVHWRNSGVVECREVFSDLMYPTGR